MENEVCDDKRGMRAHKTLFPTRVTSICLSRLLKSRVREVTTLPASRGAEGEMRQRMA